MLNKESNISDFCSKVVLEKIIGGTKINNYLKTPVVVNLKNQIQNIETKEE